MKKGLHTTKLPLPGSAGVVTKELQFQGLFFPPRPLPASPVKIRGITLQRTFRNWFEFYTQKNNCPAHMMIVLH